MTGRPIRPVLALVAATAMLTGACGPRERLHVSMRDYATNVVYGGQKKPPPPKPVPAASLEPTFPTFLQPLVTPAGPAASTSTATTLVERAPACPSAGFSVQPTHPVTPTILAPPKPASYVIRQDGYVSFAGKSTSPAPLGLRAIQNVKTPGDGTFTYDAADVQPDSSVTVTSYLVDQRTGLPGSDGLYLTQVVSRLPDGTIDQFAPADPIRLLSLPADPGNPTWASAGTDGVHNLTMELQGTIAGHGRVDACGTVLDSWEVTASGRILSPTKNLSFTSVYDIGNHFGGIILSDSLSMSGTDQSVAVAPTAGARCTGGTSSITVDTVTTIVQPAPCPGDVATRDTKSTISSSPALVK
jgi:hypothetical protein